MKCSGECEITIVRSIWGVIVPFMEVLEGYEVELDQPFPVDFSNIAIGS